MVFQPLYTLGCILLFLGMLWMFLPHAAHEQLTQNTSSHLLHTLQGAIVAVTGVIFLVAYQHKTNV